MKLSWTDVDERANALLGEIFHRDIVPFLPTSTLFLYPVPKAGVYAAQAVAIAKQNEKRWSQEGPRLEIVDDLAKAHVVVDDVLDSGRTKQRHPDRPFFVLVDKQKESINEWVSFPWDRMKSQAGPEDNVRRLLQYIGEDPEREGLKETPARVVRSYQELFEGYNKTAEDVVKVFTDGACDEMVLLRDIEFVSMCEHHMLPFVGRAHIGYIPDGKVIGVSKLARVLEVFSRRLQIQERLCQQVTKALDELLNPKGSACVLEAQHLCIVCRGVRKQDCRMVTSSLTGVFQESGLTRQEFFSVIRS